MRSQRGEAQSTESACGGLPEEPLHMAVCHFLLLCVRGAAGRHIVVHLLPQGGSLGWDGPALCLDQVRKQAQAPKIRARTASRPEQYTTGTSFTFASAGERVYAHHLLMG